MKQIRVRRSKKEHPKNKKEVLGITSAGAEIKHSVEGVEDKVSEINQGRDGKQEGNDKALRGSTQEDQFLTSRRCRKQKQK